MSDKALGMGGLLKFQFTQGDKRPFIWGMPDTVGPYLTYHKILGAVESGLKFVFQTKMVKEQDTRTT